MRINQNQKIKFLVYQWTCLVKKTDYGTKISEIESKIPSISGLAGNSALTAVENKIPDVSSLIKKTDYNRKSVKLKKNLLIITTTYISSQKFNKLSVENFAARINRQT